MKIKSLTKETLEQAMVLKVAAWQEELNGRFEHHLDYDEELAFWSEWMQSAHEHNDVRVLLGAFEDEELLGCVFLSIAEESDTEKGVEINGLWVHKDHRRKGVASRLLHEGLSQYQTLSMEKVVVYCHKYAEATKVYKALGGSVVKMVSQLDGKLIVEVYLFDFKALLKQLSTSQ